MVDFALLVDLFFEALCLFGQVFDLSVELANILIDKVVLLLLL